LWGDQYSVLFQLFARVRHYYAALATRWALPRISRFKRYCPDAQIDTHRTNCSLLYLDHYSGRYKYNVALTKYGLGRPSVDVDAYAITYLKHCVILTIDLKNTGQQ